MILLKISPSVSGAHAVLRYVHHVLKGNVGGDAVLLFEVRRRTVVTEHGLRTTVLHVWRVHALISADFDDLSVGDALDGARLKPGFRIFLRKQGFKILIIFSTNFLKFDAETIACRGGSIDAFAVLVQLRHHRLVSCFEAKRGIREVLVNFFRFRAFQTHAQLGQRDELSAQNPEKQNLVSVHVLKGIRFQKG